MFYVGVGTAFPLYKGKFGANAEGVMGIGGSNADLPGIKGYIQHHKEVIGREPDRWASPITYASLQVLQQAIERVGKIDRAAVIKEINTGTFDTIIGKVKLKDNLYKGVWAVGQWQGGDFYGIAPASRTARARRSCRSRRGSELSCPPPCGEGRRAKRSGWRAVSASAHHQHSHPQSPHAGVCARSRRAMGEEPTERAARLTLTRSAPWPS